MAGISNGLAGGLGLLAKKRKPGDGLFAGGIAAIPGFFGNKGQKPTATPGAPVPETGAAAPAPAAPGLPDTTATGVPVKRKRRGGVLGAIRSAVRPVSSVLGGA